VVLQRLWWGTPSLKTHSGWQTSKASMLFTDMEKQRIDKHSLKRNCKACSPCWGLKCLLAFLVQFNVLPPKAPLQTWNFSVNTSHLEECQETVSESLLSLYQLRIENTRSRSKAGQWVRGFALCKGVLNLLGHLPDKFHSSSS
jgi:hypothetical protein